jgi:hypothetical protein
MRLELGADNTGLKILFDLLAGIFLSSVSALNAVHLFMPFYQYFNDLKSDDKNNKKSESNDITADIVPDTGEQFRVSTAPKCAPNSNFSAESAQCRDCVLESEQGTKA